MEVGPPLPDGRVPVTIGGQNVEIIDAQMAGFGARVEILAPTEARHYLARIGREISDAYGSAEVDR
jgi:predicted DNA-binding transcriptional regulator YafY